MEGADAQVGGEEGAGGLELGEDISGMCGCDVSLGLLCS